MPRLSVVLATVLPLLAIACAAPADRTPLDDDDDGTIVVPVDDDPDVAGTFADDAQPGATPSVAIDPGDTSRAELRKFLPIGRTPDAPRFVIMRLRPSDLPNLRVGDVLRAASELQVTTRCDIGQVAPGCGYAPRVRLQLLLASTPDATDPHGPAAIALSDVVDFDCTANDHHCVQAIEFSRATQTLTAARAPGCVADNSCFVNLVGWAYHPDARPGGKDKLLLGANEGDFLDNGAIEQDRGRIMAIRERDVTPADVTLRVTGHTVRGGDIELASNGDEQRIYSQTLDGGRDLKAGAAYAVWAEVDASSNHRVDLSLEMFLTHDRDDHDGGLLDHTTPRAISEHSGMNCSPGNDCHIRKVAVFRVDRDLPGPVFVNIAASCEVPGPGAATTTIRDSGFIKSLRYAP